MAISSPRIFSIFGANRQQEMARLKLYILSFVLCLFTLVVEGQNDFSNSDPDIASLSNAEQVHALSEWCWQNREKQSDKAIEYGLKAIELAKSEGMSKELGVLYNYVGAIYQHYKDDIHTAIDYYNLGLPIILQQDDSVELAYVYNNLGDAFYRIGNVSLAQDYAQRSNAIFDQIQNKRGIAYSYVNMGYFNRLQQDYTTAMDYFEKAIELRQSINDTVGIASANLEVARTLFLMEKTDSAMHYFRHSLEDHRKLGNKSYMAYSLVGMGEVFLRKNQNDSAYICFTEGLRLARERKNRSAQIDCQLGIANVLVNKGMLDEYEAILTEAMEVARESEITANILKVYKARGEFYYLHNDYQKASEFYRNYLAAYDSLYQASQFQTLTEIKDRFHIAEQLNELNEDLEDRQKTQLFAIVFIAVLILFSVILIYRNKKIANLSHELAESNQAKDKIFSIISHDLVSPFHVLLGGSELLAESLEEKDLEGARNSAVLIQQTSEEAYRFISNLLAWSRSQRKSLKLNREDFELSPLIENVKNMFLNQAKLKNIKINFSAAEELKIYADKNLLQIVLVNLVNNAIKFTGENGSIDLSIEKGKNQVKVSVKDDGIGIAPDRINQLFAGDNNNSTLGTNLEKGTGLGLMLCKEFVELHGGEINVNSTEGKGSEFWFTIPMNG